MNKDAKKYLLVGGAGYIGCVLAHTLLEKGHSVTCLDNLMYGQDAVLWPYLLNPRFEFVHRDIRNIRSPLDFPKKEKPFLDQFDGVVLLAGLVGDPITKKYPKESEEINWEGISRLVDLFQKELPKPLVFVSTCSNYGLVEGNNLVDEDAPLSPLSLYAKHKVAVEQKILTTPSKATTTILRFATAFGFSPRMRFDLTLNEFCRDLFLEKTLEVYDADTWRPYCHVRDLSEAIYAVLSADPSRVAGQVFNVGSEENNFTKRSIVELIQKYCRKTEVSFRTNGTDPRNYRVNFSKIRSRLDFRPQYSVEHGVQELFSVFRQKQFRDLSGQPNFYGNYVLLG